MMVRISEFQKSFRYTLKSQEPLGPAYLSRLRQRSTAKKLERRTARTFALIGQSPIEVESMFLHIPKTAGKSLRATLSDEAGFIDLPKILNGKVRPGGPLRLSNPHYKVDWLISNGFLSEGSMTSSFVFTFVRNPFTRAISLYQYLTKLGAVPKYWSLHKFLRYVDHEEPRIGGFKMTRLSHAAPQVSWLEAQKWPGITRVCAFEDFNAELKHLSTALGSRLTLLHLNSSAGSTGAKVLSGVEADLIRKIYRADFESFGYPLEPPTS
jgi:hypothetical protein